MRETYQIMTFCCPPTIYRMLILGDLDNLKENRKLFVNGWNYTGDKICRNEKGYFWFVGRDDDVIKSSGYRIGPFEVESALIEHPFSPGSGRCRIPGPNQRHDCQGIHRAQTRIRTIRGTHP